MMEFEIRTAATVFLKPWKSAYGEKAQAQSFQKEFFAVFGAGTVRFDLFERRMKFSGVRRHTITLTGSAAVSAETGGTGVPPVDASTFESFTSCDPATGIETETVTSTVAATTVRRSLHGILLSTETGDATEFNTYDALGRVSAISRRLGRDAPVASAQSYDYAPCGDLLATHTYTNATDMITESYAYDILGNRIATTDAHGNNVFRTYDPFGRVAAEWDATYPVRYTYDTAGRRTTLSTTREGVTWNTITWTYDHATGNCLCKTYADGSTVTYTYTSDNLLLRTTYAGGRWTENVYDERRQVVAVAYSDGGTVSLAYDAFLNEIAFSNNVASANLDRDAKGDCTNDTAVVGNESKTTRRTFDDFSRLTGVDGTICDYNADGLLATLSNDIVLVEYAYAPDSLDAGYSLTLSNGVTFTRNLVRDGYRRSLVPGISCAANGVGVGTLVYTYDALSRPVRRNTDTFGYNARSEVTAETIGGNPETHEYDSIGNSIMASFNGATNTYSATSLNQYTSILCASVAGDKLRRRRQHKKLRQLQNLSLLSLLGGSGFGRLRKPRGNCKTSVATSATLP